MGSMTKVMQKIGTVGPGRAPAANAAGAGTAADAPQLHSGPASAFVPDGEPAGCARAAMDDTTVAWRAELVDRALVAYHDRLNAVTEQYRALRARLLSMNPTRAAQTIVITSASPGEGKSVSAANLALVMAEDGEHRILLVDADLRRASLARMLGISAGPGLADVLRREVPAAAALQASPLPNLKVLPAGKVPGNACGELLGSGSTAAMLAEFRSGFDYTFLDAPPILTVSDVSLLAPQCDGAILVIRMHGTPEPRVRQAVHTLRANHVKVLGVILSRFARRELGGYDYDDPADYGR